MDKRLLRHSFSLLHVNYVKLTDKWNYSNVISPYFRIYYIYDGDGWIISEKEKTKLEPGYLYIIPSFTLCHLRCDNYLSQYFLHFFEESTNGISLFEYNRTIIKIPAQETDIANFKRLLEINPGRGINRSDNPKAYEKEPFYKGYQELNNSVSYSTYLETQGIIFLFISHFLSSNRFLSRVSNTIPSKILDSISYIQLNLKENITVNLLAKKVNWQHDYFSRQFLHYTGERPLAYIHNKRIERALYLISTTDLSHSDIAEEIGFESPTYFSKIFKRITGLTPGEYKKRNESFYSIR